MRGYTLLVPAAMFDSWKNQSMTLEIAEMGLVQTAPIDLLMRLMAASARKLDLLVDCAVQLYSFRVLTPPTTWQLNRRHRRDETFGDAHMRNHVG